MSRPRALGKKEKCRLSPSRVGSPLMMMQSTASVNDKRVAGQAWTSERVRAPGITHGSQTKVSLQAR